MQNILNLMSSNWSSHYDDKQSAAGTTLDMYTKNDKACCYISEFYASK
jgi:hypothetical protein